MPLTSFIAADLHCRSCGWLLHKLSLLPTPQLAEVMFLPWFVCLSPLPSNRHHQSCGDCLEGKRENYQVCSVQYCVQQLYTVNCTHIWTVLTVLWIGFCLTGPISLCLGSFFCMYYFVSDCTLHACVLCSIATWWGGPGGIEAWSLEPLLPSVLWRCCLGQLTSKNPSLIWPIMCSVGR